MARKAFEAIQAGLDEAIEYAKGNRAKGRARKVRIEQIDVRQLREQLELTQKEFAELFAVSLATLRNWEQGRRRPEGPALAWISTKANSPKNRLPTTSFPPSHVA